ncbi:uncharacterized protein LOC125237253 isoform X2 [Leguminivora glycinivorella]|uniref:uncharacterized protein LOC125237253 isoform X2 n=1 Tax=Leguminivora glycinivorella TaxID=1035111 RepID=UPI00200CC22E|nr:uncharacterized protein LOC125237253 isoform X2 [Leguminivora glycinivorella]
MWLWVGLYLIVAVVTAQNDVNFTPGNKLQNNIKCEDVLLKLWTIFADQLENNGFNVKVPSRNDILYALTLIKKSILEGGGDVALKEKVFLREAELAKYKGVYLVDHRPLQTLIDQKTTTYEKANFGGPPSQYNLNSPVYSNQLIGFNFGKDFTRNRDEKVPSTINQVPGVNSIDSSKLHHAVKLSKETNHLLGSDYTSDLEHAKGLLIK